MQRLLWSLFLLCCASAWTSVQGQTHGWLRDFDAAKALAQAEGKHLLVEFSGSDWNARSRDLWADVLNDPRWLGALEGRFVAVRLDLPQSAAAKDEVPNFKRNRELQMRFDVRAFPRLLVMRPDMRVYAELGWMSLGPVEYLKELEALLAAGQRALLDIESLEQDFAAAKTAAQQQGVLSRALTQLEAFDPAGDVSPRLVPPLVAVCRRALASDPEGQAGLAQRALQGCLTHGVFGEDVALAALRLDPRDAHGWRSAALDMEFRAARSPLQAERFCSRLRDFLARSDLPREPVHMTRLAMQAAYWCVDTELVKRPEWAREFVLQALRFDSDQARALGADELLERLQ
jgi:thioredoxin-related protein